MPELLSGNWLTCSNLQLAYLASTKKLSAAFDAIVIRCEREMVLYCPHGFDLTTEQLAILNQYKTVLLITGFSLFQLPFFLGGVVNPGKANALALIKALNPQKVIHTHDEDKLSKGIVKRLAKVIYPNFKRLETELGGQYVFLGADYEPLEIG